MTLKVNLDYVRLVQQLGHDWVNIYSKVSTNGISKKLIQSLPGYLITTNEIYMYYIEFNGQKFYV